MLIPSINPLPARPRATLRSSRTASILSDHSRWSRGGFGSFRALGLARFSLELLLAGAGAEIAQREGRRVVEGLARYLRSAYFLKQLYVQMRNPASRAQSRRTYLRNVCSPTLLSDDSSALPRSSGYHLGFLWCKGGALTMTDREYRGYSERELFSMRRDAERGLAKTTRELNAWDEARAFIPGEDTSQDRREMRNYVRHYEGLLNEIDNEFAALRKEREEKRKAREASSGSHGTGGLVSLVCGCRPPRHIRLKQRELDGGSVICGECRQEFRRK